MPSIPKSAKPEQVPVKGFFDIAPELVTESGFPKRTTNAALSVYACGERAIPSLVILADRELVAFPRLPFIPPLGQLHATLRFLPFGFIRRKLRG